MNYARNKNSSSSSGGVGKNINKNNIKKISGGTKIAYIEVRGSFEAK